MFRDEFGRKTPLVALGEEPFTQRLRAGARSPRKPFKHIQTMMLAVREARMLGDMPAVAMAMREIPEYRSRSQGRHKPVTAFTRRLVDRSRYTPAECRRRGNA